MNNDQDKERIQQRYRKESDNVKVFIPAKPRVNPFEETGYLRVCAYCRVSTDSAEQFTSYEIQLAHYREITASHPNWDLQKIYSDEGISGTSLKNRDQFNQMTADCENGMYDLIVTKSVSRFARNLVDCISLVRRLKNLTPPVGVYFETDNLYTLAEGAEFMLSLLASFAQEESLKKSESMNWSLAHRFKTGSLLTPALLGYDRDENDHLVINESEATTVRFIFRAFLAGNTIQQIASVLTDIGRHTKPGETVWNEGSVNYILKNERYCGNVLTWKTFTCDIFEHKKRRNHQDRDQYLYKDTHEAIISPQEFDAVQSLLENRKHHLRGGVPIMHVIDEGVFHGYVPVNHHWINSDPNKYYDASKSAGYESTTSARVKKETFSKFDLRGYQIVRSPFISTVAFGPAIAISNKRITFNAGCVRKLPDVSHIQILLHPSERKLAIRSCLANDINSVKWRMDKESPLCSKSFICNHFATALFDIMSWNPDYSYRARGVWANRGNDEIIVFDLSEAMIVILCALGNESKKKRIITFPEEWQSKFGMEFYEHGINYRYRSISSNVDWGAAAKCRPIQDSTQLRLLSDDELQGMISTMQK